MKKEGCDNCSPIARPSGVTPSAFRNKFMNANYIIKSQNLCSIPQSFKSIRSSRALAITIRIAQSV